MLKVTKEYIEYCKEHSKATGSDMYAEVKDMHPDLVELSHKFSRDHHHVDYSVFKQRLKRKPDVVLSGKTNNYDIVLKKVD